MPYVTEPYAGKWRTKWQDPPADEKYAHAATAGYAIAARETLYNPGVIGLTFKRYLGTIFSPWLWVIPNAAIFPAYSTPDAEMISRGAPASTGQGQGTPAGRPGPGPGAGAIELAPGVYA
jgi:hypothetical protein